MGKQYIPGPEDNFNRIKALYLDRAELAAKKLPYERLDQLTVDILFGVR